MTNFDTLVARRYSCRSYSDRVPEHEQILGLLEAARLAPSACNRQPWRFKPVMPGDAGARAAILEAYNRPWIASAQCFVVVCGVPSEAWVRPADGHNHVDVDVAIATEHICLAATASGLATCWICNFEPDVLSQKLALPEGVVPMVILPVGYPADTEPEKRRKPLAEILL